MYWEFSSFKQNFNYLCTPTDDGFIPRVSLNPEFSFSAARKAVAEIKEKLEELGRDELRKISKSGQSTHRNEHHSCWVKLPLLADLNTPPSILYELGRYSWTTLNTQVRVYQHISFLGQLTDNLKSQKNNQKLNRSVFNYDKSGLLVPCAHDFSKKVMWLFGECKPGLEFLESLSNSLSKVQMINKRAIQFY